MRINFCNKNGGYSPLANFTNMIEITKKLVVMVGVMQKANVCLL